MVSGKHSSNGSAFTGNNAPVRYLSVLKQAVLLISVWFVLLILFVFASIRSGLERETRELETVGYTMHRVISQLTAQHDAHLTSLVALITSTSPPPEEAVRQVSQSILKFYPRIVGIDVVRLPYVDTAHSMLISVPNEVVPVDYGWIADMMDAQQAGRVHAYVRDDIPSAYFLAKRASNNPSGIGVVMRINARQLLRDQEQIADVNIHMSLNGRMIFQQQRQDSQRDAMELAHPRFSRVIDNPSQSFTLDIDKPIYLRDVLVYSRVLVFAIASLLLVLIVHFAWQQRRRAKASLLSAQKSEQRARLLEHETRLAHASRVNALGEMASGIAHELTQPLTALLSQSQAAVRIFARELPDRELLAQALDANVREAKRAGEMLKRMRDYMSNTPPKPALADVNQIVRDVAALTRTDLEQKNIRLVLALDTSLPHIIVDVIEMEQVLHNLVRNAADVLKHLNVPDKTISLRTLLLTDAVMIDVRDNGTGIPETVMSRLFEPFFTTKDDGMGLGLSLCATLVERVGGRIEGTNYEQGGAVFTVYLPLPHTAGAL
jgi:two-component system sensor kinase FixL